ncbi:MAG: bifunctional phosphoserine phosphatase/homoserine phosphotransferase ThrH [Promethearchaeota archaeon]|jgi:phosphoserine/homoserine phosphotransferase
MHLICLDLEGVFTPEIWEAVAENTKIDELKLTTRDLPDYDILMRQRLRILRENKITLADIQAIILQIELLPGALEFYEWLRKTVHTIIVTDSYVEFVQSFAKKLGYPMIFCHNLEIDEEGMISHYNLRLKDMKKKTIKAFKKLNYNVIAIGDSYNDTGMLSEADYGIFFKPPKNVVEEFPQFPVTTEYTELKKLISNHLGIK